MNKFVDWWRAALRRSAPEQPASVGRPVADFDAFEKCFRALHEFEQHPSIDGLDVLIKELTELANSLDR